MLQDRRQFQRVTPGTPLVVVLDKSKYNLLFDFSEEGLAVEGLVPRDPGQIILLEFNLPGGNGSIQGRAEIVWTNESEHRTGLHFLDLADTSRTQLSEWISTQICTTDSAERKTVEQVVGAGLIDRPSTTPRTAPIFQGTGDPATRGPASTWTPRLLPEDQKAKYPEPGNADAVPGPAKQDALIGVALAAVLLTAAFGFAGYFFRRMRDASQTKSTASTTSVPALSSPGAIASVNSSPPATLFSPPTSPLDLPGFVLQVAAMTQEDNADALARTFQQKSFPAFVFKRGNDRFYRVAIGPYSDKNPATQVKNQLDGQGVKSLLRPWTPE